jgi:hypothetical protein
VFVINVRTCCLLVLFDLLSALCLEHQAVGDITLSLAEWFSTFRSSPVGTPRTAHPVTVFYPRRPDAVTCPGCCLTVGARGKLFVVRVVRRTRVLHSVSASCWCFVLSCRVRCVCLSVCLSLSLSLMSVELSTTCPSFRVRCPRFVTCFEFLSRCTCSWSIAFCCVAGTLAHECCLFAGVWVGAGVSQQILPPSSGLPPEGPHAVCECAALGNTSQRVLFACSH